MQQKFIEVERSGLIEHLMLFFNNRNITYQIVINQEEKEDINPQKNLNSREKYQLMIEQYPNIKILRDKIRLELDY
jgi:DNA polymerase III subunit gamma/tau